MSHSRRAYGLVYPLSDAVRHVYPETGPDLIRFNGDDEPELPMPATFLIGVDAPVKWSFVDADFTRRPDPGLIVAALETLDD